MRRRLLWRKRNDGAVMDTLLMSVCISMLSMISIGRSYALDVPTKIQEDFSKIVPSNRDGKGKDDTNNHEDQQQRRSLIIGGHDAVPTYSTTTQGKEKENPYPYFGTLDHYGGGVLIAPDILLTAGHVMPPMTQNVQVRLNHPHFQSRNFALEPSDADTYRITAIVQHPEYYTISWDEKVNDFNLFILDGLSSIQPVKLNRNPQIPNIHTNVTVIGMGSMSPDPTTFLQTTATTLQEVQLKVLSHKECIQQSGNDPMRPDLPTYKGRVFDESMICTSGGVNNEKDACAFDSGSPLLSYTHRHDTPMVVGLVSWGEDCADPYYPAVNARISHAMSWIDTVVCTMSKADLKDLSEFGCEKKQRKIRHFRTNTVDDTTNEEEDINDDNDDDDDDDDDDDYWTANLIRANTQFRNYNQTYTPQSGFNAMLALVIAGGIGLALMILRLLNEGPTNHGRRQRQGKNDVRSSVRYGSLGGSIRRGGARGNRREQLLLLNNPQNAPLIGLHDTYRRSAFDPPSSSSDLGSDDNHDDEVVVHNLYDDDDDGGDRDHDHDGNFNVKTKSHKKFLRHASRDDSIKSYDTFF